MSERFDSAVTELSMAWRAGDHPRIARARAALEAVYADEKWGTADAEVARLRAELGIEKLNRKEEVERLRAEVVRLTRERQAAWDKVTTLESYCAGVEAERDAALGERDEARAAINYAMSERAAALAESAALRARLEAARLLLEEAQRAICLLPWTDRVEPEAHPEALNRLVKRIDDWRLAADPKETR